MAKESLRILTLNPALGVISKLNMRVTEPDSDHIDRLAENIALNGQEQPGLIRFLKEGKGDDRPYEVLVGGCRFRAVKALNDSKAENESPWTFKAVEVKADDAVALQKSIAENEFRLAANIVDRAQAVARLKEMGKSGVEIAQIFGVSPATITVTSKVLDLPKKIQNAIAKGQISFDQAMAIASLASDKAEAEKLFDQAVEWQEYLDSTVAEAEEAVETEEAEAQEAEAAEAEAETPAEETKGKKSKAKAEPKKKGGQSTRKSGKKGQVSGEAVRKAAKAAGKNVAESEGVRKRTVKEILDALEAINTEDAPTAVKNLCGALAQFIYKDRELKELKAAFTRQCRQDGTK